MLHPSLEIIDSRELSNYRSLITDNVCTLNEYRIQVVDHTKVSSPSETFIEYKMVTERSDQKFTVYRRYSDFEWLIKYLTYNYPFHILPPLPPKRLISTVNKFHRPFIDKRQISLSVMMQRLCFLTEIMADARTQKFLRDNQKEFDQYRAIHKNPSLLSQLKVSFKEIYGNTIMSFGGNEDLQDEQSRTYTAILYQRIMDRTYMNMIMESLELCFEKWEEYSFALLWLAQDLADLVLIMNKSEMSAYVDAGAQLFFNLSTEGKSHFSSLSAVQPIFTEYVSYNDHIIRILKQRNRTKRAYNAKSRTLKILEVQNRATDTADLPKGNMLDQSIKETTILEDNLEAFDEIFKPGFAVWKHQRSKDIASSFNVIVTSNLRYHRACLELCKHVLTKIGDDVISK